jgi:hypothetical protein
VSFENVHTACPVCGTVSRIIDANYSIFDDVIDITLRATATGEDREAMARFLSWLKDQDSPPTPEQIDQEYPDLDPAVRNVFHHLTKHVPWPTVLALILFLISYGWQQSTNAQLHHIIETQQSQITADQTQSQNQEALIRQLQQAWAQQQNHPAANPITSVVSGRANPKGTPPRGVAKKRRHPKHR